MSDSQVMTRVRFLLVLAATLAALFAGARVTADEARPEPQPVATIHISAKSISAGVGYSWGKGTLEFQGKTHSIRMAGLLVLAVGITVVNANGRVYDLKSLDDFDGTYEAPLGASAIGEGGPGVVMRNAKGVEVRMVAENTGVTLSIGDSPVKLALER